MQIKYIELPEFKKYSCQNIDVAIPKINAKGNEDEISEALADKIRINKRRRRRFKRSFYYAKNIIEFTKEELNR